MARPLPPEEACLAVFEAKHYAGLTYSEIVDWTHGQPPAGPDVLPAWRWEPISRGCAYSWYKAAAQWWTEHHRLSPDEEYAGLRHGLDLVASEVVREYRAGRLDVKTFAELSLKVAAEVRTLTGAGYGSDTVTGPPPEVSPRAVAAIEDMKARREQRERMTRKAVG